MQCTPLVFKTCLHVFINLISASRHTQEYFTCTNATSVIMGENHSWGNPRSSTSFYKTFLHLILYKPTPILFNYHTREDILNI